MKNLNEGAYTVKIKIANKQSLTSLFDLRIIYICQQYEQAVEPLNSYVYRYDENPPVPYIYKISPFGEVKIRFSTPMEPKASLNETEAYPSTRNLQVNRMFGDVPGLPTPTFTNYTSIHNRTVRINGTIYPSFSVAIRPFDPEDPCARHLDFIWKCINYTAGELTLQLDFTTP